MRISPQFYPTMQSIQNQYTPKIMERHIISYAPRVLPIEKFKKAKTPDLKKNEDHKYLNHAFRYYGIGHT